VDAFDDQCTGANPRYPLIAEFRAILLDSYYGKPFVELTDRKESTATAEAEKGKAPKVDAKVTVKVVKTALSK
jgi:acetaldehyde dehydrogenase/alcohol dehydrogenase